jgi:acyl carrier protein
MNAEQLLAILKLPQDADTGMAFDELGVDSWNLVELRAVLETKHGIRLTDDEWLNLESPDEVLRVCR